MFANQWQICSFMATSETAVPVVGHKDHLESEDHAGFLGLLVHQVLLDHHQRSTGTLLINASAINWIQNSPAADYYMKDIVTNWYTGLFVTAAKAVELTQLQSAQNRWWTRKHQERRDVQCTSRLHQTRMVRICWPWQRLCSCMVG